MPLSMALVYLEVHGSLARSESASASPPDLLCQQPGKGKKVKSKVSCLPIEKNGCPKQEVW